MSKQKRVFVDMDNVLVDFQSGIDQLSSEEYQSYKERYDDVPGIFSTMKPLPGGVEGFKWLANNFETYILSTAPWGNPSSWTDKRLWVEKHIGEAAYKRLILSHHKNLLQGDYIIDDRTKRGVAEFDGTHIHFGQEGFENWDRVLQYFKQVLAEG